MKIHFDGWSSDFDFWTDDDWPDLHPPGWCLKTGHPLQPPLVTSNGSTSKEGECSTPGCTGFGHVEGARYATHTSADNCPYSSQNLHRENPAYPDRLAGEEVDTVTLGSCSPIAATETPAMKEEPGKVTKSKTTVKVEQTGDSTNASVVGETSSPLPPVATKSEVDQRKPKVSQSIDLPVKSESETELNNRLIQVELRPESPPLDQHYDSLEALTPPPKKQ